jgi:RimJ/RimL family protein N-acetyltransferase
MSPLTDVAVRELRPSDLEAYKALRDHALAHHEAAFNSDAATEARRSAASYASRLGDEANSGFALGAFRGDRLVGAVTLERDPRIKVRHIGHVIDTMVHSDEIGHGVGRALMGALVERASADPELQQLTLTVTAGNAAAERLYSRAGFVVFGTQPRAIRVGNRFLDKHHMVLNLR